MIDCFCFTEKGIELFFRIQDLLKEEMQLFHHCTAYKELPICQDMKAAVGEAFQKKNGILFIGAMGIAVRMCAPFLQGKEIDPAVLVMDEAGKYVIPVLSGHLGGACALGEGLADLIGAQCVHTTASDVRGAFAIDVFAKQNELYLRDLQGAKILEASYLAGERLSICYNRDTFFIDAACEKLKEKGIDFVEDENIRRGTLFIKDTKGNELFLGSKKVVLGMGCKKGIGQAQIKEAVERLCITQGIQKEQICALASISEKAKEPGLCAYAGALHIPFHTYTGKELLQADAFLKEGESFSFSSFVQEKMGVDTVCERAALLFAGRRFAAERDDFSYTMVQKEKGDGVTTSLVIVKQVLRYE